MKWSILILTVGHRHKDLKRLLKCLLPQVEKHPDIEVLIYWNAGEHPVGTLMKQLVDKATGDYICFIDDDDLVSDDYVAKIYPLLDGIDYIGFKMRFTNNGKLQKPVIHSLKYPAWTEDEKGFYRNITHKNPILRSIAIQGDYQPNWSADHFWSISVAPITKTEHFVNKNIYYYLCNDDSMGGAGKDRLGDPTRPTIKHKQVKLFFPEAI